MLTARRRRVGTDRWSVLFEAEGIHHDLVLDSWRRHCRVASLSCPKFTQKRPSGHNSGVQSLESASLTMITKGAPFSSLCSMAFSLG